MVSVLGYAALVVAIGGSLGMLQGPAAMQVRPIFLLIPLGLALGAVYGIARFAHFPKINDVNGQQQLLIAVGIVLAACVGVMSGEFTVTLQWPSKAAAIVGISTGLALVGAWIERDASLPGAKISVLLLYVASGLIALSTLLTNLPPSTFWVVSAIIPAWQARRQVSLGELEASFRLLNAATRMFLWVLAVALWLPALLLYR